VSALSAEVAALDRLLARDRKDGGAILDRISVAPGYERALGAALADDLRAPRSTPAPAGTRCPAIPRPPRCPRGPNRLPAHVTAPPALARRLSQIGLVEAEAAASASCRSSLPGQRLVTRAGDLWRWDGLMQRAEDAPSAAAQRLEQMNRLAMGCEPIWRRPMKSWTSARAAHDDAQARSERGHRCRPRRAGCPPRRREPRNRGGPGADARGKRGKSWRAPAAKAPS
jgi:chromosome segregation protein